MRFIKFMRFKFIWLFILILVISGGFGGENKSNNLDMQNEKAEKVFTAEFYIALLIGVVVLSVIGWVVWLVIRGPKNKWDK